MNKYFKCANNNEFIFLQKYFGKNKIYLATHDNFGIREYYITTVKLEELSRNVDFPIYLFVAKDIINKKVMVEYCYIVRYHPQKERDIINVNVLMREKKFKKILKKET